jgi:methionine synthase I (cobalamin-dependent)
LPTFAASKVGRPAGETAVEAAISHLSTWQRNTYGIRCTAFAAHVRKCLRKCLRFAAPAVPAGHSAGMPVYMPGE